MSADSPPAITLNGHLANPEQAPAFAVEVPVSPRRLVPLEPRNVFTHSSPRFHLVSLSTPRRQLTNLIHAEILAVTSAMRKNQRWASTSYAAQSYTSAAGHRGFAGGAARGRSRDDDDERGRGHTATSLMSGFMELKMRLRDIEGQSMGISSAKNRKEEATDDPARSQIPLNSTLSLSCIRSSRSSGLPKRRARSPRLLSLPSTNSSATLSSPRRPRTFPSRWHNFRPQGHIASSRLAIQYRTKSSS